MNRRLNEVKQVQIGITTRCNSNCRFCFREELLRSKYGNKMKFKDVPFDLPFDTYKRIFKDTNLTDVQFCGNKGDAIFHPDFENIINYTIDRGVFISLATNGSNFSGGWWYNLGKRMKGEVTFALDGLEKTHQIYRSTPFQKVYSNMLSFIEGGGFARWQYIVFKHNEYELEAAKQLSKEIGCGKFITVVSRYYDNVMEKPISGTITKRELHQKKIKDFYKYPNIKKHVYKVFCQWRHMQRVYVGSRGTAYPCCYVSCHIYPWYTRSHCFHLEGLGIKGLGIRDLGIKEPEYSVANNTLNEIIKLPMFAYIYDNINNLSVCDLHCTNLKTYKTKMRREEKL
jgi:molybdenum cofactor biosynthesis enzyme MoaA